MYFHPSAYIIKGLVPLSHFKVALEIISTVHIQLSDLTVRG